MDNSDTKLAGHTPVSSASTIVETAEQPGNTGADPGIATAAGDVENVAGYVLAPAVTGTEAAETDDLAGLPDIAWASYGAPSVPTEERIFGTDDRVQVTATANYPWRANASLLITAADNSRWIGTGWFLGPHTLGTAGHVVFIKNSGVPGRDGWVRSIQVIPGRNGSNQPFGSIVVSGNAFRSVTGWTVNGDQNFDYGAIVLPNDTLGNRTGWFGFGAYNDATLLAATADISGYPGDKPAGTQWFHASRVASVNERKVFYQADTMGGQSGSAVYRIVDGQRMAFGIHAYGGATANSATRINTSVFGNLLAWRA
ncbi:trypsin-like serine peptidase [Nocardia farcinica]|uniref:trypsin-like serine peptidase n=1 Tax=Nocardia farcinica TaxID=37329 RepID=UPI0024568E02|nr:serine protease [Nocardia farcinica]